MARTVKDEKDWLLKRTLSYSSLRTYWQCPEKFRRTYINQSEKVFVKNDKITIGNAVHSAIDHAIQVYNAGVEETPEEIGAIASEDVLFLCEDGLVFDSKPYIDRETYIQSMQSCAYKVAEYWARRVFPSMKENFSTIHSEREFTLEIPNANGWSLRGFIDCIGIKNNGEDGREQVYVIDWKTKIREGKENEAHLSKQLSVYGYAARKIFGRKPDFLVLNCLTYSKKCDNQVRITTRTDGELDAIIEQAALAARAIDQMIFPPNGNEKECNQYCDIWTACRFGGLHKEQ
jgi:ATP-dependent helicase/DNAse subunit B